MSHTREEKIEAFGRFIDILDILREKCPWDHKQTNESLRPNTIEETYELCDALIRKDNEATKKELGDVLLHIAFYAKIGEENGSFDIADVCNALCEKLIYRHPHVFGTTHVDGSNEVEQNWEELKLKEKGVKNVTLMPLMMVAGDHANNDMAGDEEDSHKTILQKEGFKVNTYIHGIGENKNVRSLFVEHANEAWDALVAEK